VLPWQVTEVETDVYVAGVAHPISFFLPDLNQETKHWGSPVTVRSMDHVRRMQTAYEA
jgi:hypothetical protein